MRWFVKSWNAIRNFRNEEEGSHTVEAVIWVPIFVIMMAAVVNIALVFFQESQILRVVQDANRAFSVGRFTTEEETETYVTEELAYLSENLTVNATVDQGWIETSVSLAATEMMPMRFLDKYFTSTIVEVSAQHVVEY